MTTSNASPTPTGEDAPAAGSQRALRPDEATTNLLEAVLASDNLARAWKRVKANKGAPGIDGVTIEAFPAHARDHWTALREQINQGRYRPQAVRRVEIPGPDGGRRLLGIPTATDRVVQQAIKCSRRASKRASRIRASAFDRAAMHIRRSGRCKPT